MQATNGSLRSRTRVIGCLMATALVFSALVFASSASAAKISKTYLALGDSLAFGYSQQLYNEHEAEGDPATAFEHGYVNNYAVKLMTRDKYQTVNLGCPGETTKSLLGNGPVGKALEASPFEATTEAPCAYQEAWAAFETPGAGGPLHHPYVGKSQLEAALEEVAVAQGEGTPVSVVTLNIGANDELATVHGCEREVGEEFHNTGESKYGGTPEEAVKHCLEFHVEGLIETIIKNTEAAAYALRHGSAFGGVDYTGPIRFLASYDPYGAVFTRGEELLPGSVPLAALINAEEAKHFSGPESEGGFEGCVANALPKFNPSDGREPGRLQAWTNMANFTEFEGKKNGPDIHPTPAGYEQLSKILAKGCGR
jgi:hypothetical protein